MGNATSTATVEEFTQRTEPTGDLPGDLLPCPPGCQPVEMPPPGPNSSPGTWNFQDITQNGQQGRDTTPLSLSMHLGDRKADQNERLPAIARIQSRSGWVIFSIPSSDLSLQLQQTQQLALGEASPWRAGQSQPPHQLGGLQQPPRWPCRWVPGDGVLFQGHLAGKCPGDIGQVQVGKLGPGQNPRSEVDPNPILIHSISDPLKCFMEFPQDFFVSHGRSPSHHGFQETKAATVSPWQLCSALAEPGGKQ